MQRLQRYANFYILTPYTFPSYCFPPCRATDIGRMGNHEANQRAARLQNTVRFITSYCSCQRPRCRICRRYQSSVLLRVWEDMIGERLHRRNRQCQRPLLFDRAGYLEPRDADMQYWPNLMQFRYPASASSTFASPCSFSNVVISSAPHR